MLALDIPQETADFWRLGHMFGAECYTDLTAQAMHLVAAKVSVQAEVRRALTSDLCSVVEPKKSQNSKQARWLQDCAC